jgi:hypothetical protein
MGDHASGGNGGNASGGGSGGPGGGIGLDVYQSLALTNSTVANNVTGAGGAAGSGGPGGAGYLTGAGGGPGNGGAGGTGGGIFTNAGTLTFATIAGNHTSAGGPGGATGAGCQPTCGTSANGTDGAYGTGGGIEINGTPGISMANTLVGSNLVPGGVQNCVNHSTSAIGDGGHNLSYGDATCPGINGNPLLGPLQNNGGTTQTMAIGGGSAAIDKIPVASDGCPGIDQRGVSRPLPTGGQCDIGAFEAGFTGRTLTVTVSGAGSGNVSGTGIDCGGGPTHTTCSTTVADGGQITLSATPASGSRFGTFSGGGCGATSQCTVTMSADTTVDARFDKPPPAPLPPQPPPPPPPTGAGGGLGAGAGPGGGGVTTAGKALIGHPKVTGTTVSITVACTGAAGASCSITTALSIIEKLRGGKVIAVTAARVKNRVLVLGLTRTLIRAGQTRTVRVSLNGIGRSLLAKRRAVQTKLVVRQSGRAISTSIVHFKSSHVHKHKAGR